MEGLIPPTSEVQQKSPEFRIRQTVDQLQTRIEQEGRDITTPHGRSYKNLALSESTFSIFPERQTNSGLRVARFSVMDVEQGVATGNNIMLGLDNYVVGGLEERYFNKNSETPHALIVFGGQLAELDDTTKSGIEAYLEGKKGELQRTMPPSSAPTQGQ